jgi:3-oxoacyl-[acyl-carrier protein] reductase
MTASGFSGRIALVTGGSGGIGAALCRGLAEGGASVAVHYATGREAADRVVREIVARGGTAAAFGADLVDASAPDLLIDEVESRLGPVDILAANAGWAKAGELEDVDADAFDRTIAINLRAPYLLARRVLPGMRGRGYGRILFTSSIAALIGGRIGPDYAASKAGLSGLTHYLASRAAPDGVTVNAIMPALIEDTAMLPGTPDELAQLVPVGRLGRPEEVADLALAMLANGYLTNQLVGIDGGMRTR